MFYSLIDVLLRMLQPRGVLLVLLASHPPPANETDRNSFRKRKPEFDHLTDIRPSEEMYPRAIHQDDLLAGANRRREGE